MWPAPVAHGVLHGYKVQKEFSIFWEFIIYFYIQIRNNLSLLIRFLKIFIFQFFSQTPLLMIRNWRKKILLNVSMINYGFFLIWFIHFDLTWQQILKYIKVNCKYSLKCLTANFTIYLSTTQSKFVIQNKLLKNLKYHILSVVTKWNTEKYNVLKPWC